MLYKLSIIFLPFREIFAIFLFGQMNKKKHNVFFSLNTEKVVPPLLCPYMIGPTRLGPHNCMCPDTFVPTHLCPHTFVPRHVRAQTHLCPHMTVPTWLSPHMTVPRHVWAPDMIVPRHISTCQLDWWKHKHAQLLLAKRSERRLFNYVLFSNQQQYCYWNSSLIYYCMPGHQICVWAQTCLGTNVHVSAQTWLWPHDYNYNMSGYRCVWAQTCVSTNMSGHKCVWAQTCQGTNVAGQKRVWAQTCVGTNVCGHKRVVSRNSLWYPNNDYTLIDIRKLALDAAHCK